MRVSTRDFVALFAQLAGCARSDSDQEMDPEDIDPNDDADSAADAAEPGSPPAEAEADDDGAS